MLQLLEWISDNGYVTNKDEKWYKPSEFPRVYLENEKLIELYNQKITYETIYRRTLQPIYEMGR